MRSPSITSHLSAGGWAAACAPTSRQKSRRRSTSSRAGAMSRLVLPMAGTTSRRHIGWQGLLPPALDAVLDTVVTPCACRMGITRRGAFFKDAVDCTGVDSMNAKWTFDQLEALMYLLCDIEVDKLEEYEEEELRELLQVLVAIVLDGPNVNKSALADFEKKHPWVSCLICLCHCISNFFKAVFKLPTMKAMFKDVQDTATKFRNVKWLRDLLEEVQGSEGMKELPQFAKLTEAMNYIRHASTRMGSKYDVLDRAHTINPATKMVVNHPKYEAKYEADNVAAAKDDSDDEYERKDRRSLSDVLRDCKKNWITNTERQKLAKQVLVNLKPAKKLLRKGDSDKLMSGKQPSRPRSSCFVDASIWLSCL